jgi:hypothetical protein
MEVNYLLIVVTTAIACALIFFLTWKNRRDLRKYERKKIRSEVGAKPPTDEGEKLRK